MAIESQLFYIGTSKVKEIRRGGSVTFDWGAFGKWTDFKNPVANSTKKVQYNKNKKNHAGASAYGGVGGVTRLGSTIPATATRVIAGVERTCDVRYYVRGYTRYTRTTALKRDKKMKKTVYTKAKPFQYRLQYKDKPIVTTQYSAYVDGVDYIYFANQYYDAVAGVWVPTNGHLPHPQEVTFNYSDIRKNFDTTQANNSDGRDNKGSYILSNVRANVLTIQLKWAGLTSEAGADLIDTLNPTKDSTGKYNYLTVQYLDPATNLPTNKTCFASDRSIIKYANGAYKEIAVTLTEV